MDQTRLTDLLNLYLDGALTAADRVELERALKESADARRHFWQHTALHGLTYEAATLKWAKHSANAGQPRVLPATESASLKDQPIWLRTDWRWGWGLAAAAVLSLGLIGLALSGYLNRDVAVLARAVRADWADGTNGPVVGAKLKAGSLHLLRGAVQIDFRSGARVVFEGPAIIQLTSSRKAFCRLGRFHVQVPKQARGFQLQIPGLNIVDLGTSFGLNLPPSAPPEVHTFSGQVQLTRTGPTPSTLQLAQGQAVLVVSNAYQRLPANPLGFLQETDLARWDLPAVRAHHDAWEKSSRALSADPATLLHYTFEDQTSWQSVLTNQVRSAPADTHGRILGCTWTEGRWPGRKALRFDGDDDRVRFHLPQMVKAITCLIWARVDGLPNGYVHSLLTGDSEGPGTMRWTISQAGNIRMGVASQSPGPQASWAVGISPPVITTNLFGKWLMLACVYDGKTVQHYLDGQPVWSGPVKGPETFGFGWVELGNWVATRDHPDFLWATTNAPSFFNRDFLGCIGEVAVVAKAMPAQEIQRLYTVGRPLPPAALVAQKTNTP